MLYIKLYVIQGMHYFVRVTQGTNSASEQRRCMGDVENSNEALPPFPTFPTPPAPFHRHPAMGAHDPPHLPFSGVPRGGLTPGGGQGFCRGRGVRTHLRGGGGAAPEPAEPPQPRRGPFAAASAAPQPRPRPPRLAPLPPPQRPLPARRTARLPQGVLALRPVIS